MFNNRTDYIKLGELEIAKPLYDLVKDAIAPDTGTDADNFWELLADIVRDCGPENAKLLAVRDNLQKQIDEWHVSSQGQPHDVCCIQNLFTGNWLSCARN